MNEPNQASKASRSAGRALVETLHLHGVDRIFCVPGESYLEVLDALVDYADIDVVVAKHEGAAANMAEADGKLTGRPGICFVTRGPGATHASIGVHIAAQDSTPMILFIGQIARGDRGREAFQEIDYERMFGGIAKWVFEIDDANRIPELVARAFHCATSGRPGPVVLSLPEDMLTEACSAPVGGRYLPSLPSPSATDAQALRAMLLAAQRPLVIVGGAIWSDAACADFAGFIEAWDLPVACAFRRQHLFDNRREQYIGHLSLGVNPKLAQRLRDADLVLAIGTRLGDVTTDGYTHLTPPRSAQRLIHIHADANELGRVYQPDLGIVAAPEGAAAMLRGLAAPDTLHWRDWTRAARREHQDFVAVPSRHAQHEGVHMAAVMSHLNHVLPENAIVSNGAGNYAVWVHQFYQYRKPRTQLAPTCGAMGYGFPAAIAAKLRVPERTVVCFAGDGCFLMYPQELATAMQFGAAIVVIVVNNGMYGTIRMHQERRFPGRVSATAIRNPDFVTLAQAFGAHAERVDADEDFPEAFERACGAGRPALIELRVDTQQITPRMRID
ncbi:thiamine pyrophosphate-binding protein [Noviherbaspirillum pedocola]|uniref:Thiamine pyrophosphate-binding protein n=1 Tax=Noviherbaspirillum pedocola TaxID=2801341 RepID=A0A934W4Y1_9BURK|nr:thiamine pyrophosphate-binding protein [Noviherbaspirillum pedocola]MBK4734352.1 thiamine pyrophosphate-binding protein [Noviherbaspirillum pedocola]